MTDLSRPSDTANLADQAVGASNRTDQAVVASGVSRTPRIHRIVLAIEIALGVLPVTIVGGVYALMGVIFGTVSVLLALQHRAFDALALWFGILGLALGGIVGISGLWLLVVVAWMEGRDRRLRTAALMASTVGVVTAVIALTLAARGPSVPHWTVIYLLVSPIGVVCHRAWVDRPVS